MLIQHKAKKKNCYVALTRPKFEKLGRSVDFFFFFFSNIFFKFLNGENSGGMQSKRIYTCTSAFLSHWIQILANSSPKSDIFNKKTKKTKKKNPTLFFRILRSVGRGQHNNFFGGPSNNPSENTVHVCCTYGTVMQQTYHYRDVESRLIFQHPGAEHVYITNASLDAPSYGEMKSWQYLYKHSTLQQTQYQLHSSLCT